jgi:TIR domain/NB-ARC domain
VGKIDFFLSRRGSVAAVAREVHDVLTEEGYKVIVQDYDMPFSASFVLAIHEAIKNCRDLVVLFTRDYDTTYYTREEFASFWAQRAENPQDHHIIILRCEDVRPEGLLAHSIYQDLVGITDTEQRRRRIIAAIEQQSQAPLPKPQPFEGVPSRIASFTGRTEQLHHLDEILVKEKPAVLTQAGGLGRVAIKGMGGVGKTSLAVEYAHRYQGLYAGVCWCPAERRDDLLSSLASLAEKVGAVKAAETDKRVVDPLAKTAKAALDWIAKQRAPWLLIYDNVTNPTEIKDLLPAGRARLLITSRYPNWTAWATEIAVDMLPPAEAVDLLQRRALRKDKTGAQTLANALGRLPLALDHAAAYCQLYGTSFADYAATAGTLMDEVPDDAAYPRSVAATFKLALDAAAERCPAAEQLIEYLAFGAPERIPMMLVDGAVENDQERRKALAALAAVSLVKHDSFEDEMPAVSVHRLVQTIAQARAARLPPPSGLSDLARTAAGRMCHRLLEIYPDIEPTNQFAKIDHELLCARLTPHLLMCRRLDPHKAFRSEWATLSERVDNYLFDRSWRPFMGVPPRTARFTGRTDELLQLNAILMQDKPAAVTQVMIGRVAVQGMSGVGKTSLAIEYAHRFKGLYAGVCWCPAETRTGLLSALASLAVTLGAATAEEADVEKAAKAALRRLAEQRATVTLDAATAEEVDDEKAAKARLRRLAKQSATWLLVYDNVTTPDHILDLLPSAGARVLITSRFSDWSELADEVALDVLPLEEAIALLESRTGRSDAAGARTLAEALGSLPLALDHAAAYCKRTQMRFADYATKASSLIDAAPRGAGYPRSVAATLDLAIKQASAQCPAAGMLITFLAQCAPERIPLSLVEGAIQDSAQRQQAIFALAETSLLNFDPFEDGTSAVILHRLVRAVAQSRSEGRGREEVLLRLAAQLMVMFPRDHRRVENSARIAADALDALGRTEEAKELRERYGVVDPENSKSS